MAIITALPATDLVACRKIAMKGYPVGVLRTASISVNENRAASIMANPSVPLSKILNRIDRGITTAALRISSDI